MGKIYDVIIIGGGSMGMSAGYHTAKQGLQTLVIDKYDPPHDKGSHHGSTRAIRHAYGEGSEYVPLVLRAQELWEELQNESEKRTFERTGVLGLGKKDSAFIRETVESAEQYGLDYELLSSKEIQARWDGLHVPESFVGCFEKHSGVLFSEEAVQAYRTLTEKYGAQFQMNTEVTQIVDQENERILVNTNRGRFVGKKVIVTGGANIQSILPSIHLPIQPVRKTFAWYQGDDPLYHHETFPAFFVVQENSTHYGMPNINGEGVKIGRHDQGQPIRGKEELIPFGSYQQDIDELNALVDDFFPQLDSNSIEGQVCTYARTPDEDFIIDSHPESNNIVIAGGFSGHGFKFSSVVGEILCNLVMKNETTFDLSMFSLKRFESKGIYE